LNVEVEQKLTMERRFPNHKPFTLRSFSEEVNNQSTA